MVSTVEKEDNNYLLQTVREVANSGDANFNVLSFTRAKGNVSIKMRMKFDHYKDPGMYVFYINGYYNNGSQLTSMQCGDTVLLPGVSSLRGRHRLAQCIKAPRDGSRTWWSRGYCSPLQ